MNIPLLSMPNSQPPRKPDFLLEFQHPSAKCLILNAQLVGNLERLLQLAAVAKHAVFRKLYTLVQLGGQVLARRPQRVFRSRQVGRSL